MHSDRSACVSAISMIGWVSAPTKLPRAGRRQSAAFEGVHHVMQPTGAWGLCSRLSRLPLVPSIHSHACMPRIACLQVHCAAANVANKQERRSGHNKQRGGGTHQGGSTAQRAGGGSQSRRAASLVTSTAIHQQSARHQHATAQTAGVCGWVAARPDHRQLARRPALAHPEAGGRQRPVRCR